MTVLEHCRRVGCSQVVGALKQRIAELEAQHSDIAILAYLDAKKESAKRIAELEAALDVALEALVNCTPMTWADDSDELHEQVSAAIAKLKGVRK